MMDQPLADVLQHAEFQGGHQPIDSSVTIQTRLGLTDAEVFHDPHTVRIDRWRVYKINGNGNDTSQRILTEGQVFHHSGQGG